MPIPSVSASVLSREWHWHSFLDRARWNLKFCWLPKRCAFSKRMIWMEHAYRGVAVWTGPGDPVVKLRWAHPMEYMISKIKGDVR